MKKKTQIPSKGQQLLPHGLTALGVTAVAAGAKGFGIESILPDGTTDVSTWPVISAGIVAILGAFWQGATNFTKAASAPPVDENGNMSSRYTCSIALMQAHQEGDKAIVDLLAQTVPSKKPAPPPESA